MRGFIVFCWAVTIACAVLAALMMLTTHTDGAVQQAAIAAQATAMVIIPYVFTKAFDGIRTRESGKQQSSAGKPSEQVLG
ncbi:MAG: hypothetical protein ACREHV_01950 [Rhizomicrobium sp.]